MKRNHSFLYDNNFQLCNNIREINIRQLILDNFVKEKNHKNLRCIKYHYIAWLALEI